MKTAIWCYFPLSAGISPHGRYQPHGQWSHLEVDATGRDRVNGWLSVGYHVSGVSGPGRVGHSDPPTTIYRLYLEAHFTNNWGSGVLSVGSSRYVMRLEVLVPYHQADMYESCN
jgi:hypothetical protein